VRLILSPAPAGRRAITSREFAADKRKPGSITARTGQEIEPGFLFFQPVILPAKRTVVLWCASRGTAKLLGTGYLVYLQRLGLAAVLCLFAASLCVAQTQQAPSSGAPPQTPPAQAAPAPDSQATPPQASASATKPPTGRHHVITNDDLKGKGSIPYAESAGIDLSAINDCDRNCFQQVQTAAHIPAGPGTQWKRDLLAGIEKVRADADWQARLDELGEVKGKYCDLESAKNEDLAEHSDPKNVTEDEISIEEMYQRKFEALQSDLMSAENHAEAARINYSGIVVEFMYLQQQRIVNATCPRTREPSSNPRYYNDDAQ